MTHIIVLRFSAMGDVLMTVPVIDSLARQYPDVRITVVSRPWAKAIFEQLPKNVKFVGVDLHGEYAGYKGLNLIGRRLLALQPSHIADLHDVLRTKWLRLRLNLAGLHVEHINKDRRARKAFIEAPVKEQQRTAIEKYVEVFHRLGFTDLHVDFRSLYPEGGADLSTTLPSFDLSARPERYWVGIAPFAAHQGKVYPRAQLEEVIQQLDNRGDTRLFLFGAGKAESDDLDALAARYTHVENVAGKLQGINEELALISHCKAMLTMDSSNMHLASLAAVPVISIWGATHPLGGFLGYRQSMEDALQCADLTCRPCSIYGHKPCLFGDYHCMTGIAPETVVAQIEKHLR